MALAQCDAGGCSARFQVQRGDDPTWALQWAGWYIDTSPEPEVFCPQHLPSGSPGSCSPPTTPV